MSFSKFSVHFDFTKMFKNLMSKVKICFGKEEPDFYRICGDKVMVAKPQLRL